MKKTNATYLAYSTNNETTSLTSPSTSPALCKLKLAQLRYKSVKIYAWKPGTVAFTYLWHM
jgi:hypothetical protein